MKPIELNLAGNPYRNDTPLLVGLGVLAAAALLFTSYNGFSYFTADSKRDALVDQLADHRAQMEAMRQEEQEIRALLGKIDAGILQAQADLVSRVLNERNFSWTGLLNQLEGVLPWNVRLSSIRPQFGESNVTVVDLRGTAMDVDAFYAMQDSLENSPRFTDVQPGSWQLLSRGAGNDERITFNIQCRYLPPSAEERAAAVGPAGGAPEGAADDVIVIDDLPDAQRGAAPQPESFAAEGDDGSSESEPAAAGGRSAPVQRPAQGVVTRPSRKAAGAAGDPGDAATPRTKRRNAMRTSGEPADVPANLPMLRAPVAGGSAVGADPAAPASNPRATRSGTAPPGATPEATVPGTPRPPAEAPSEDDPAVEVTEDGKLRYRRPFLPEQMRPAGEAAPQPSGDGTASGGGQ